MDRLSAAQVAELREELLSMLERIERSMRASGQALAPVELDQTVMGRLSRMDALQNQGLTRNLHEREQVRLTEIHKALQRLEAGTYGVCVECGEPIPFGRLVVVPEASTCAACGEG